MGGLWTRPGVAAVALAGLVARLPGAMLGLALVLAVTGEHSPAAGGLTAAAIVVGTGLAGPLRGRLVDRRGARPVLVGCAVGQALAQVALVAAVTAAVPVSVTLVLAAVTGAFLPPVGPVMRTLWARMFAGEPALAHAAQAAESVVIDIAYVVAPLLVAAGTLIAGPAPVLALGAVLTVAGCLALCASPHLRNWPVSAPGTAVGGTVGGTVHRTMRAPGVVPLLVVGFLSVGSINATEFAVIRLSHDAGAPAAAGWLIAALSLGSIVGGLAYGARRPPGSDGGHLTACLLVWAAAHVTCAVVPTLWGVGVVLVVNGLVLTPSITAVSALLSRAAPHDAHTEAFGWLGTAGLAGGAAAAAVGGLLVTPGPFLLSAALAVTGVAVLHLAGHSSGRVRGAESTEGG